MDWQISERQEKRMLDSGGMQLIMLVAIILPAIWIYCDAAKRYDTKVKTVAWLIAALLGWFYSDIRPRLGEKHGALSISWK